MKIAKQATNGHAVSMRLVADSSPLTMSEPHPIHPRTHRYLSRLRCGHR